MNGGPFRVCHSPARFVHRPVGRNVFRVEARTQAGATSQAARYVWTVRRMAPGLVVAAPVANRYYNAASWSASCAAAGGLCGTLRGATGRPVVVISIRQLGTGRYWNGHDYLTGPAFWAPATLLAAHAGQRAWSYRLAVPPRDGGYTVTVRSSSRLRVRSRGHGRWITGQRTQTAVSFILDTLAPPAPVIISGPASPNSANTATVRFSDAAGPIFFRCALDGAAPTACTSPVTYTGVTAGRHRFSVWAIDEAGNRSGPGAGSWQQVVASGQSAPFTITGQASGRLYPGGTPQAIPLTLGNPSDETIYVTNLGAALQVSRLPPGCSPDGFQVRQPRLPLTGVVVPARTTVTLPTPAVGAASIQMIDTGSNQDACQNAALPLTLTGSAHT
jgi:hypothetical protein